MYWSSIGKGKRSGMPVPETSHLLILGGTAEAAQLAETAEKQFGAALAVTTSLAGATRAPKSVAGALRVGGFGGASGLAAWIRREQVHMVVDATHPFATQISANSREACTAEMVPRLVLSRPHWQRKTGDRWHDVPDLDSAAGLLPDMANRVFLSIGSQRLEAFSGLRDVHLVVRMIDPPPATLNLSRYSVVLGRGPFDVAAERDLLHRERIDTVVSRNSGGMATYAKIAAARMLNLPVVMIAPPTHVSDVRAESLEGALQWIDERIALRNSVG